MILITGANGRLGKLIAGALLARGATKGITLGTRDPDGASELHGQGFDLAKVDFSDTASLEIAYREIDTLFMISATGPVEIRKQLHRNSIEAAKKLGIKRIIYTSRVNPSTDSHYRYADIHADSEKQIIDSGLSYTILRNNEYTQNLKYNIDYALKTGELVLPGATGTVAYISVEEIAEASCEVILSKERSNKIYEFSGSRALNCEDIAGIVSRVTGSKIGSSKLAPKQFGEILRSRGLPDAMVELGVATQMAVDAGEFSKTSSDPEKLTGRPGRSISELIANWYK